MNTSRLSIDEYKNGILAGDRVILAKAITLMESVLRADQQLADALLTAIAAHTGKSLRIGITGAPGAGKSTFIEAFGQMIVRSDKKLAVLTVDPSSQITGGSILGDKTRMSELARDTRAFIRPSPAGHALGGVASYTREAMLLCEAAGFDTVIVETVGTGQSEITVRSMVDFFLLLIQPGAGDELQGIKKGVVEIADAIAITKSDGQNLTVSRATMAEFQHALHLMKAPSSGWTPKVLMCSALQSSGLEEIHAMIEEFYTQAQTSGHLETNRRNQGTSWFREHFQHILSLEPGWFPRVTQQEQELKLRVRAGDMSPRDAAQTLLKAYHDAIKATH